MSSSKDKYLKYKKKYLELKSQIGGMQSPPVVSGPQFATEIPERSKGTLEKLLKKICIVGTMQSGSTRLFNLVRMIYEKNGKKVYSQWNITPEEINKIGSEYDIILCKIHDTNINYLKNYDIILLPIRNILDSALSAGKRLENTSTKFYKENCNFNINLYNKFKSIANLIFRYENYNVYSIKKVCTTLNINLNNNDILDIMIQLESMLNNKNIAKNDDHGDAESRAEEARATLVDWANTSNGKTNKFINLPKEKLDDILEDKNILTFLEENFYF